MKALHPVRQQLASTWQALSVREQRGLVALGVLLTAAVVWFMAIAPALHTLRESEQRRLQIGQQHAHMLALQQQAQTLQTRTPLSREEALRLLQSLTPQPSMQLNVQGERVSVQLKAVPAPTLATWLAQARSQAQALPVEAHLSRQAASANTSQTASVVWDGSVVLALPNRASAAP